MAQKVGMADTVLSLAGMQDKLNASVLTAEDFDELVRRNQKRIFRLLMALLRDEDAADTLTQECFLKAYKSRSSFRGDSSVDTWVYRIAVNLARDYQRSKRQGFWKRMFSATPETEEQAPLLETVPDGGADSERQLLAREEVEQVWYTVRRLSENQREVFVLRYAEDLSLEEIANTLEMQVGTVKSHLNRALTSVRKRLEEHRRGQ
jgi:RNA polymerase sigma-70 factor, ECF subfamily